ncbi:hypothetical protein SAMN04488024_107130 [Pedobacter soli]|uniref:Uncharacterized protein n=1 Tax=Pedobacter soli TaxID=390242 RepID=A0A1G6WUZ9_9SPHI|nr:hypothetical protein SAMN04488024_107130 [Pedobacter soli]
MLHYFNIDNKTLDYNFIALVLLTLLENINNTSKKYLKYYS